jgi:DNA mismatch repair protein MutL
MSLIQYLDLQTANSIAAGEVVERPASVVKELVENALDAGASVIQVEIRQGGIGLIRVTDNGCGMDEEDARLAFGRHATSKIRSLDDLWQISTMGFRGEALASIAAVSHVRLETRLLGEPVGTLVEIAGGELITCRPAGCAEGTTLAVENLFFNTPARFKFLKKDSTEAAAVADVLEKMALARPDVSFRLVSSNSEVLHTPGNNDLRSTIFAVFGKEVALASLSLAYEMAPVKISGYAGLPDAARNSRSHQCFFVNGRLVRSRVISAAIDEAYATHLMKRRFPLAVIRLDIPPDLLDVNVHPQKMEVRFWDENAVFRAVYHAIQNALINEGSIVESQPKTNPTVPGLTKPASSAVTAQTQPLVQLPLPAPQPTMDATPAPEATAETLPDAGYAQLGSSDDPACLLRDAVNADDAVRAAPERKTIEALRSARLIGQLFATYLMLEEADDLLLIDQHAAHERILFEQLVARHRSRGPAAVQPLLMPLTVEVSAREQAVLLAEQEQLLQLGFEFEAFGTKSVLLRAVPDSGRFTLQPQAALRVALDALLADRLHSEDQISDFYYSLACKAAVKAHDRLEPREMDQLLNDLLVLDDPYHCPHGRPIIIRISRHELEKQFKRIV